MGKHKINLYRCLPQQNTKHFIIEYKLAQMEMKKLECWQLTSQFYEAREQTCRKFYFISCARGAISCFQPMVVRPMIQAMDIVSWMHAVLVS